MRHGRSFSRDVAFVNAASRSVERMMVCHSETELSQAGVLFDVLVDWLVTDMVLAARYEVHRCQS